MLILHSTHTEDSSSTYGELLTPFMKVAKVIPVRVLGLPKSIEIDQRPDKNRQEIQAKLYLELCCSKGGTRTSNKYPCLLPERMVVSCYLHGVRIGVCPGVGLKG